MSAVVGFALVPTARADLAVPGYNSNPGAPTTVYINFGGFTFNGAWGDTNADDPGTTGNVSPGVVPAYTTDADTTSFSSAELSDIQHYFTQVASYYSAFNINVTTVDPGAAVGTAAGAAFLAANPTATPAQVTAAADKARQNYYDSQPNVLQEVVGGDGAYNGGNSANHLAVMGKVAVGNGDHTGFASSSSPLLGGPGNGLAADVVAHEAGHAFGLLHQTDWDETTTPPTNVHEYALGNEGVLTPIMGQLYGATRTLFANGLNDENVVQNDAAVILASTNGTFRTTAIGHSLATATPLTIANTALDPLIDTGVIVPASAANPNTTGSASYRPDYFSFASPGGTISLTVNSGTDYIVPGVVDASSYQSTAQLNALLEIFTSAGALVASVDDPNSFNATFTEALAAGNYYAEILAVGNAADIANDGRTYFEDGAYFLTGSGFAVPEPTTISLLILGGMGMIARRRRGM